MVLLTSAPTLSSIEPARGVRVVHVVRVEPPDFAGLIAGVNDVVIRGKAGAPA